MPKKLKNISGQTKQIKEKESKGLIIDNLQNLKVVLGKILGHDVIGEKYIHALNSALKYIDPNIKNQKSLKVGPYNGIISNKDGDLHITIKLIENNDTIDKLVYYSADVFDDTSKGES